MRYVLLLTSIILAGQVPADDFDDRMKKYAETSQRDRRLHEIEYEQQRQREERYQDQRKLKCEIERLRAAARGDREPFCLAD